MNYETLLKMVKNMNKNKGDKCLICHFPITNNQIKIKLKCEHNYHFKCIKKNIHKRSTFKCWYCYTITHSKKCIICKKRHYFSDKFCINHFNIKKCDAIFKSGKRKGKKCNRINCKQHKKITNNLVTCQTILKSGKRKGGKCNRVNCYLHKKKDKVVIGLIANIIKIKN